jgi:hypothetical protein
MIVAMETRLAGDRSADPVRPCPDVHPPAVRAPTPIAIPAAKRTTSSPAVERWPSSHEYAVLASGAPARSEWPRMGPAIHQGSVDSSELRSELLLYGAGTG